MTLVPVGPVRMRSPLASRKRPESARASDGVERDGRQFAECLTRVRVFHRSIAIDQRQCIRADPWHRLLCIALHPHAGGLSEGVVFPPNGAV